MASKKSGRLAGLAALAGLAYMATKDKDKPDAKKTTGEDDFVSGGAGAEQVRKSEAVAEPPKLSVDLGEIRDEAGASSKLRRNTETGELYDPTGPSSRTDAATKKVTGAPRVSVAPVSKAPVSKAPVIGGPNPARAPGGIGKRGGASSEEKTNTMNLSPYRENPDSYDMSTGKRGGAVKKMASGGMTASSRGDGIATKGKTRGRMC